VWTDFGLASSFSIDQNEQSTLFDGVVVGTFGYLPPEYFNEDGNGFKQPVPYSRRADVYAFGVILAELFTGHQAMIIHCGKQI